MDGWMDEGEVTAEVGLVAAGKSDGGARGISLVSDAEEKVMMTMMIMVGEEWAEMQALGSWESTPHAHRQAFCGGRGYGARGTRLRKNEIGFSVGG